MRLCDKCAIEMQCITPLASGATLVVSAIVWLVVAGAGNNCAERRAALVAVSSGELKLRSMIESANDELGG